jgi:hypothetical protein
MTDIVPTTALVNARTGEALTLDSPTGDLARLLDDIKTYEGELRDVKAAVSREILKRMDQQVSWTINLPGEGLKLTGLSPDPVKSYDGPALRDALYELVDEGLLTIDAVNAAVETVVISKPRMHAIANLRKLGGRVKETVDSYETETPRDRRVSVSRP